MQTNLSKVESCLPEERMDDEVVVETAAYGENYEALRHTLTAKQISSKVRAIPVHFEVKY
jgi:hypothetical protein